MPPCADVQQDAVADAAFVLRSWSEAHPDFLVGTNEAGMKLGDEVRGADVAVWRAADAGEHRGKFRSVPPILAVEVAGEDEDETVLREKARWYLGHGVRVVWLMLPDAREVVVIEPASDRRFTVTECIPEHADLPGLSPEVRALFTQILR